MTTPEPRDLPEVLTRLDAWMAADAPEHHAGLRPGLDDEALDATQARLGLPLPAALRTLYRWHDGGEALGLWFLPLHELEAERASWADIAADPMTALDEDIVSHPPGAIRPLYATPDWLPILNDGGGNVITLDLHPGPAGTRGQVITAGPDEDDRYVLAPDLEAFLREYLRRVEAGRVTVRRAFAGRHEGCTVRLHDADGHAPDDIRTLANLFPSFGAAPPRLE